MQKEKTQMRIRDIQQSILKRMLRKNPQATVSELAKAYETLKTFITKES